jgi:hypothetical protein
MDVHRYPVANTLQLMALPDLVDVAGGAGRLVFGECHVLVGPDPKDRAAHVGKFSSGVFEDEDFGRPLAR